MANTKYTTSRAGRSRLRCSTRPVEASTPSTSDGGNADVNTPIATRSDKRSSDLN